MTYHRTGGKGGTRNSPKERHPKHPNFNKNTAAGAKQKPRTGRVKLNPGKHGY